MATTNFYLDRADKEGKCFILMTYLAGGQKFRHSVKLKATPNQWVKKKQRLKEVTREDQLINAHLDKLEGTIKDAQTHSLLFNHEIDFAFVKQRFYEALVELDKLKRIKRRFDPAIVALCNQLATEKQNLAQLETAYTQLSQQQEAAVSTFFTQYKDRVNHYLKDVFKTAFLIDSVAHIAPQGRALSAKLGYKLVIDGQDLSFVPNAPYCAKECLSEGDKTTIALALFLSKLDIDPQRCDKILVFDDPLSSLDTNRRGYTTSLIKQLVPQMKQVIVLSHNEYFLNDICTDISNADKKTLRITENFVSKASVLETCDLSELVKNDYFRNLEKLEQFRITPDHSQKDYILGLLRNVLEAHLKFKFYSDLRSLGGHHMFGRIITHLNTQGVVFKDNAHRTQIIAKLHLINDVSWKPHHGTAAPNFATLGIDPNSITARELDNLIVDTLTLVDTQI
jgi:hypothetical protein